MLVEDFIWLSRLVILFIIVDLNPVTTDTATTIMTIARIIPVMATLRVETADRPLFVCLFNCNRLAKNNSNLITLC